MRSLDLQLQPFCELYHKYLRINVLNCNSTERHVYITVKAASDRLKVRDCTNRGRHFAYLIEEGHVLLRMRSIDVIQ